MGSHSYYTRLKDQQYRAAGVLPFAVAPAGQLLVLLGRERGWGPRRNTLRWKDFGGHREAIDEDVEATAAREFSEETLGLFGGPEVASCSIAASSQKMSAHLRGHVGTFRVDSPLKNGGVYSMFVAQVAYIEPLLFNLATQENAVSRNVEGAEKCGFAWVEAKHLLAAIEAEEAGNAMRASGTETKGKCRVESSNLGSRLAADTCQANKSGLKMLEGNEEFKGPVMLQNRGKVEKHMMLPSQTNVAPGEFRRSVVAVMVEGPKPPRSAKGGRPKKRRDQKLLLHSSFVCTLRRAQAGGLLDFLSRACFTPCLAKEIDVTSWEGVLTSRKRKEREPDQGAKRRKMSSECLMYWVLHAKKLGALETVFDAREETNVHKAVTGSSAIGAMVAQTQCEEGVGRSSEGANVSQAEAVVMSLGQDDLPVVGQSVSKHQKAGERRRGDFLDSFPPEQRGTIAGAFHEAVRKGALEPSAVIASVLARATVKMDQARSQHAPASKPSSESSRHGQEAPELTALVDVPMREETKQLLAPSSTTSQKCEPDCQLKGSLVGAADVCSTRGTEGGIEHLDHYASNLHNGRQSCSQSLDPESVQPQTFASCDNEALEERTIVDMSEQATLSGWELCARQYASESHLREGSSAGGGESIGARAFTTVASTQTAAAAWGEVEKRLISPAESEEALAYARSVIEWASLGSAEKKKQKKRRRLALSRK